MTKTTRWLFNAVAFCATICAMAGAMFAGTIAYQVPAGTAGNQAFGGSLGMDFEVLKPVTVTRLGVFDDGSNGLALPLNAHLYETTSGFPLASSSFAAGPSGTLVDGSRFQAIAPVTLYPGFRGTIVGEGYGVGEQNGNQGVSGIPGLATNGGAAQIGFLGGGRFGGFGAFPVNVDGGPANRYAAGTFEYSAAAPSPSYAREIDITTQGNWIGKYGSDGYIFNHYDGGGYTPVLTSAQDRTSLPSYVSSYSYANAQGYSWDNNAEFSGEPQRALLNPDLSGNRRATTAFSDSFFDVFINVNQPVQFQLGLYFVDWDSYVRNQMVLLPGRQVSAVTLDNFHDGRWVVYDVSADPNNPLIIRVANTGGVNAVMSGIAFDPQVVPEPGTIGLAITGLVIVVGLIRRQTK